MDNNEQVLSRLSEDILLRGLSKNTLESYTIRARIFLEYCNRPVEQLDVDDIRNFLQYLIHEKKSSPGTVNISTPAFIQRLPSMLSKAEVPFNAIKGAFVRRNTFPHLDSGLACKIYSETAFRT